VVSKTHLTQDFGAQVVEMNGEADHVHLLVNYPPKHSVSSLVNSLMSNRRRPFKTASG
jgi:putative transposase